jgi:hypothetical protein
VGNATAGRQSRRIAWHALVCVLIALRSDAADLFTDADAVVPTPDVSAPRYLRPTTDPAFDTRVTRITDDPGVTSGDVTWGDRARHGYSKVQPWNADESLLMILNSGRPSTLILDGETYEYRFAVDFAHDEIRWHPTRPNVMVYTRGNTLNLYDVASAQHTLLRLFAEYEDTRYALKIGPWEGNLSNDGAWIALVSAAESGEYEVYAYDISADTKHRPMSLGQESLRADFDWASMSASGTYVVIQRSDTDTRVYDREMNFVGKLPVNISHFDLAVDVDEEDVAVGVSKPGAYDGSVVKVRLRDGHVTRLTTLGYASHTSTRNIRRRGWAYVTYQTRSASWPPYHDEIVAVKMDGSGAIERYAHMHALRTDYPTEAQACPSPDGRRVVFASTWDEPSGRPIGCYVVDAR